MTREPVGEIKCPWCRRDAELHRSESRPKLNPDAPKPAASYPVKYFVICPPTTGYRGCGTTLANSGEAQVRMMENGKLFGPGPRLQPPREAPAAAAKPVTVEQPVPAVVPPAPQAAAKKLSGIFDW